MARITRILTKTAPQPAPGGWLTLMALDSEWMNVTGEAPPGDGPRAN